MTTANPGIRAVHIPVMDGRMEDQSQAGDQTNWAFGDETEAECGGADADDGVGCFTKSIYPGTSTGSPTASSRHMFLLRL